MCEPINFYMQVMFARQSLQIRQEILGLESLSTIPSDFLVVGIAKYLVECSRCS